MRNIPLGETKPDEEQTILLARLGFDLNTLRQNGKYWGIELPTNPNIRYKEERPDFDKVNRTIYCNEIAVITIRQKTAGYDSWCMFAIDSAEITKALAITQITEHGEVENNSSQAVQHDSSIILMPQVDELTGEKPSCRIM